MRQQLPLISPLVFSFVASVYMIDLTHHISWHVHIVNVAVTSRIDTYLSTPANTLIYTIDCSCEELKGSYISIQDIFKEAKNYEYGHFFKTIWMISTDRLIISDMDMKINSSLKWDKEKKTV